MAHDDDNLGPPPPGMYEEPAGLPDDWQMATMGDVRKTIIAVQQGFDGMMAQVREIQSSNATTLGSMAEVVNSHADALLATKNMVVNMGLQVQSVNERMNALERYVRNLKK